MWDEEQGPQGLRRLTRAEFQALGSAGVLPEDASLELIQGVIIEQEKPSPWQSSVVTRMSCVLREKYQERADCRIRGPVALGPANEPYPELTVVRWRDDFYASAHPEAKDVLLLIEVADSSRAYDLGTKCDLYAREGVEEFWVVDRKLECVHVFRPPLEGVYRESRVYARGEDIPLPECGGATLSVDETGV